MTSSEQRILTTHCGSLPRPVALTQLIFARQEGRAVDDTAFRETAERAVRDVVRRQIAAGIDIVSDGEMAKPGFINYIGSRLTGFGGMASPPVFSDLAEFPHLVEALYGRPGGTHQVMPRCEGEVAYCGDTEVARDIDALRSALADEDSPIGFLTAASPGCLVLSAEDDYYGDYERYLFAMAEAMRTEYRAIVDAGFVLQLDCPDLAAAGHSLGWLTPRIEEMGFSRYLNLQIEALNAAVAGLPAERMRVHVCWGNYPGPHHKDIPLSGIIESVMQARPAAISFEAANPRHEHEWEVLRECEIPADKVLVPGLIDTKTNVVEHPRLVAQRIERFADVVGRERVVAGTDCGFSTFAGWEHVEPDVAWLKLTALAEGAAIASARLWGGG